MASCSFFGSEKYRDHWNKGVYECAKCGHELFSSQHKFEHSSPWPTFSHPFRENSIFKEFESEGAWKVRCGNCREGLGHEFVGDYTGNPSGQSRF